MTHIIEVSSGDGIRRFHFIFNYQIMALIIGFWRPLRGGTPQKMACGWPHFHFHFLFIVRMTHTWYLTFFSQAKYPSYFHIHIIFLAPFSFSLHYNLIWLLRRVSSGDDMRLTILFTSFYFHTHFHFIIRLWLNRHIVIIFDHHIIGVGFARSWLVAFYFYMILFHHF